MPTYYESLKTHSLTIAQWVLILSLVVVAIVQLTSGYVTEDKLKTYKYVTTEKLEEYKYATPAQIKEFTNMLKPVDDDEETS